MKAIFRLFLILLVANFRITNGVISRNELSQVKNQLTYMNFPAVKSLFKLFPMPLTGIFGKNILLIKTIDSIFKNYEDSGNFISKLARIDDEFAKLQNRVAEESKKATEKFLSSVVLSPSNYSFWDMQLNLDDIFNSYSMNIDCILKNNCDQKSRIELINKMMEYASTQRSNLRSINKGFRILSRAEEPLDSKRWFFDHVIQEYEKLEKNDDDCNIESLHTRIFKAWVHITNVLTKGYSAVSAAYAVELRRIISDSPRMMKSQVYALLPKWKDILKGFRNQMGEIMLETKSTRDNSSREIRNCGSFNLIKEESFVRLNFIHNRLTFYKPDRTGPCTEDDVDEPLFNNNEFAMFNCIHLSGGIFYLYMNREDKERTFQHLDRIENGMVKERMGKDSKELLDRKIIEGDHIHCPATVCQAYQRRELKYSTQFVQAQQDYVVTGIRWKIKKNVIYIEIQEGKFIDGTQVNESTVHWKETPENDKEVKFLDKNLRSIALADIILPEKIYVKGVSLKDAHGMITIAITGQGTDDTGTELLKETSRIYENTQLQNMIELKLDQPDDPEIAPVKAKNLVMREKNKYFVKFQPTDLKKDFGRTTIPYFDIREVVTTPSAPISGLGIYHEAVPGYGGFVGLKMFSPDFLHMINKDEFDSFWNDH